MTILLAKDLRLSLDAIRPWVVILLGLVAAAAGVSLLPAHTRPSGLNTMHVTEAIAAIGGFAGMAGVVTAAWIAATVAHGDGRHGARSLAIVLPVAGPSRVLSKLLAIAMATAIVSAVAILLRDLAPSVVLARAPIPGFAGWLVALLAFIGAALALGVAPLTRAVFPTVMVTLLLAMIAAAVGALAGWIVTPVATSEFARVADAVGSDTEYRAMVQRMASVAVAAGIVGASLVALQGGMTALLRPRSSKRVLGHLGLSLVGAFGVAAAAVPIALRFDAIQQWSDYHDRHIHLATDEQLVTYLANVAADIKDSARLERERHLPPSLDRHGPAGVEWPGDRDDATATNVALTRVMKLPLAARTTSPLAVALRQAEDYSTWLSSVHSLRLIPNDEPRKLAQTIDVVLAFPEAHVLRRLLDHPIAKAGGWTNQRSPLAEGSELTSEDIAKLDAALLGRIRTLRTLEAYRDLAERFDRLRAIIPPAAAPRADEAEHSPEALDQPAPSTGARGTAPPSR